ncbi:RagB/SusD family nutrient uptake outer membrane protein [Flavobacteriaceae bacterium SZ-1-7]|uniref:RagB/SusD family nutrient uptake outer membrane protein n=1 Tax=Tamlana sedimenti TaxID=3134126 RepID=UPI0031264C9D
MKKYIKYTIALVVLISSFSCEEAILDLEERDGIPAEILAGTEQGVEALLAEAFEGLKTIHSNPDISLYKQCGTDIAGSGTNMGDVPAHAMRGMNEYTEGLSAVSESIETLWNTYYTAIAKCNSVVVGVTSVQEPSATLLDYLGQAYTLRAYAYLELVRRWDNIVISEPTDPNAPPVFSATQATKEALYTLIISDLETAIPILKKRSENGNVLAPSKGLANMLLAEANLDMGNWQAAATAADIVINEGSYQLQNLDYIFGLEGGKSGEENNTELVFSWGFTKDVPDIFQYTSVHYNSLYDRLDGIARTMAQGGRPWGRFSPTDYYWSLFDNEDGRLQAWHKLEYYFDDAANLPSGRALGDIATEQDLINQFGNDPIRIHYLDPVPTKFWEDSQYGRSIAEGEGWRNIIVYRLSNAYLLAAEAYWRLNQIGTAAARLNTLRERAYGDNAHNFASVDMETIIEEHARELGHEGHRWAFLKRLGILRQRAVLYNPSASGMQDKNERWPIPQSFIDLTGINQNTNY